MNAWEEMEPQKEDLALDICFLVYEWPEDIGSEKSTG
jgi:hypothetical protein